MDNVNQQSMLSVGTTLQMGKYRIERYLSSGGFGNTYVAYNTEFEETIAIKEFFMRGITHREANNTTVSVSNDENRTQFAEQLNKFKKEARRIRRLHNDHIVAVHDLFEENGTAYYVMDYVNGESLAERIKRLGHPLDEQEVRAYLPQILDALQSIHSQGIWHLDLKPGNIMVDRNGTARLIDFGASKQTTAGTTTTSTATAYTPGYAPREQMEQNVDKFGPWTDLYALGGTIYNLLTRHTPPMPSDIDEHGERAYNFMTGISPDMKQLVRWLMTPNRQTRPQSVAEVFDRINQQPDITIIKEQPSPQTGGGMTRGSEPRPKGKTPQKRSKKYPFKNKDIKNVAVIAAVIAFVVFGILWLNHGKADLTTESTDTAATVKAGTWVTESKQISPDGSEYTYSGPVDDDGLPHGSGEGKWYDGRCYKGEFSHGNLHGECEDYKTADGKTFFTGTFENGHFKKGKLMSDDGTFEGEFKDDEPYNGTATASDGTTYQVINGEYN